MTDSTPTTTPAVTTALPNQINASAVNVALDQEFVANFKHESDRLMEVLGIFKPEVMRAGETLYQRKITGSLNNDKDTDNGRSSGTSYVEGEEVALSKYEATKTPVGTVDIEPYRKATTAAAIAKSGYEVAVLRTDRKMLSNVRGQILSKFFTFLGNGTGTASGTNLQKALAKADAKLGDTLEANGDETSEIIHFINRQDAADYLGSANISTQDRFGLTYLADFLGVQRVFLTSKVASGSLYVTPVENIHIFGLDFSSFAAAGLAYTTDESGLIGVAHTPAYNRVSAETHVINGTFMLPEVKDYIVKGTIAPSA